MRNNFSKITDEDCEIYKFKIPFIINKNKRNAFISKELEKEHPCFSNNCCFDTKYKFENKGLVAKIAVMNKVRLEQYKREFHKKNIIAQDNEKYFVDKKQNIFTTISFFCILIVFFSVSFCFIKNSQAEKMKKKEKMLKSNKKEQIAFFNKSLYENIFESIEEHNGKIEQFDFDMAQDTIKSNNHTKIKLNNCFPEDIFNSSANKLCYEINFSSVAYNKNKPNFTLEFTDCKTYFFSNKEINANTESIIHDVRNQIILNNGNVNFEDEKNNEIEFSIDNVQMKKLITNINSILKKLKYCCTKISIISLEKTLNINLTIYKNQNIECFDMLEIISNYIELFTLNRNTLKQSLTNIVKVENENNELIGKIKTAEGKIICYYKNKDGKIMEEEE